MVPGYTPKFREEIPTKIPVGEIVFPIGFVLDTFGDSSDSSYSVVTAVKPYGGGNLHEIANFYKDHRRRVIEGSTFREFPRQGSDILVELCRGWSLSMLSGTEFARFIREPLSYELKQKYGIKEFKRDDPKIRELFAIIDNNVSILQSNRYSGRMYTRSDGLFLGSSEE